MTPKILLRNFFYGLVTIAGIYGGYLLIEAYPKVMFPILGIYGFILVCLIIGTVVGGWK
jgi:hypothetical protein